MTQEQRELTQWLNRAFYAEKKINALKGVRKQNKAIAESCTISYNGDGTTSGTHDNSQEKILHQICDNNLLIQQETEKLVELRSEIFAAIALLKDDTLEAVLFNHYLAYHTWEQVAEEMNYAVRTIKCKHKKAIEKLCIVLHSVSEL